MVHCSIMMYFYHHTKGEINLFTICPRGFRMTFPNRLSVSVQWNAGNYCENNRYKHDNGDISLQEQLEYTGIIPYALMSCDNAEVAVIHEDLDVFCTGFFANCSQFDVIGWCTTSDVLNIMNRVANTTHHQIIMILSYHSQWEKTREYDGIPISVEEIV